MLPSSGQTFFSDGKIRFWFIETSVFFALHSNVYFFIPPLAQYLSHLRLRFACVLDH